MKGNVPKTHKDESRTSFIKEHLEWLFKVSKFRAIECLQFAPEKGEEVSSAAATVSTASSDEQPEPFIDFRYIK